MNLLNLILSGIVSGTMSYFSIINLAKNKFNVKNMIVYILFLIPCLLLIYAFFDGITRLLLNIIFTIMALYLSIFKKDISNSVYYAIIYELLVCIFEIIISVVIVLIFKIDAKIYAKIPFSLLISSIINCSLIYIITKIKFVTNNIRKLNENIKKNNKDWIYIIIVMILLVLLMVFNRYKMKNSIEYYISIGLVIFVVVSFVYVIYNKFQR